MRDFIQLAVNGHPYRVSDERVFGTLSDFLRLTLGLTGTKIVCAEGDCGSCTTLVGEPRGERFDYAPVCSCILLLGQLDGCHIVTVEGLSPRGQLNEIQSAMVRSHGAQCGFCTPGFVVAMAGLFDKRSQPTDAETRDALCGNLCRCTGYEAILAAAAAVDATKVAKLESLYPAASLLAQLSSTRRHTPSPGTLGEGGGEGRATLDDETISRRGTSPSPHPRPLPEYRAREAVADDSGVQIAKAAKLWFRPSTIADACLFKRDHPTGLVLAGGTDLGVLVNKAKIDPQIILHLGGLVMDDIAVTDSAITFGAGCSFTDVETTCAGELPEYARLLRWWGSPPIKNAGTLGGNIATGSPIGDSMPPLFVLGAQLELTGVAGPRLIDINAFYTGYRASVMQGDELITRVIVPKPKSTDVFRCFKVSRRRELDISSISAAMLLGMNGRSVEQARVAFGGVGPTIMRLPKTESFLAGKTLGEETLRAAGEIAASEVTPITDVRGSREYRLALVRNIFLKLMDDRQNDSNGEAVNGVPKGTRGMGVSPMHCANDVVGEEHGRDAHATGVARRS